MKRTILDFTKKRILLLIIGMIFINNGYSQYLGWKINRIHRNLRIECDCEFEISYQDTGKVEYIFKGDPRVFKMIFFMNKNTGRCFRYAAYCANSFENSLQNFISENYIHNGEKDYYENNRSVLFLQYNDKNIIIHILDKRTSSNNSI